MSYGPKLPEDILRGLARERIAPGALPIMFPDAIAAGYGTEVSCSLCGEPIHPEHVEYEVSGTGRAGWELSFHAVCYAVWQLECVAASADARP